MLPGFGSHSPSYEVDIISALSWTTVPVMHVSTKPQAFYRKEAFISDVRWVIPSAAYTAVYARVIILAVR